MFDEETGDGVITDFAGDRIDLTAFGFTRSQFEQQVRNGSCSTRAEW